MPGPGVPPTSVVGSIECWPQWFLVPVIAIFLVIGLSSLALLKSVGLGCHQLSSGISSWKFACVIAIAVMSTSPTLRVHIGTTGRLSSPTK